MSSTKLIILGVLRHTIGILGTIFVAHGYLTPEQQTSWTVTAVQEAFGAIMIGTAYLWSVIDKKKVIAWGLQLLHIHPTTPPAAAAAQVSSLLTPVVAP